MISRLAIVFAWAMAIGAALFLLAPLLVIVAARFSPTPVFAPPNGSTADGWLCVSALTAMRSPSKSTMPALPTNAERTHEAPILAVAARSWSSNVSTSGIRTLMLDEPPVSRITLLSTICERKPNQVFQSAPQPLVHRPRPLARTIARVSA